jgi:hypothetical protein
MILVVSEIGLYPKNGNITLTILKIYGSQPTSHGFSLRSPTEVDAQTCFCCTEISETKPSNLLRLEWGFYGILMGILWDFVDFNGDSMGF